MSMSRYCSHKVHSYAKVVIAISEESVCIPLRHVNMIKYICFIAVSER